MARWYSRFVSVVPALIAGICLLPALACSKKLPTAPESRFAGGTLEVRGCSEAEGFHCRATFRYRDGGTIDGSNDTRWIPSTTGVKVGEMTGVVKPRTNGRVTITGTYNPPDGSNVPIKGTQTIEINNVPPMNVGGLVADREAFTRIVGAKVEVTRGPDTGMTTFSNANGEWALTLERSTGLVVRFSHPDYHSLEEFGSLWIDDQRASAYTQMRPLVSTVAPLPPSPSPPAPTPPTPNPPTSPVPPSEIVDEVTGTMHYGTPTCYPRRSSGEVSCVKVALAASPHGMLDAELSWTNDYNPDFIEMEFEVWQAGVYKGTSSRLGGRTRITASIDARREIEIRILITRGSGPERYRLRARRYYVTSSSAP
jgi:hypothetical protein